MKTSPWGPIQDVYPIADGIVSVSTAGHGGIKLDRKRQAAMPDYLKREGGWYEEDCEWSLPGVVYGAFFEAKKPGTFQAAKDTMANWFPELFEKFFGVELQPEQSYILRERKFHADHADSWITIAAWGDWHDKVPAGMVGVVATKGGKRGQGDHARPEEKWFLVPESEYDKRDHFGFVINGHHAAWVDHA